MIRLHEADEGSDAAKAFDTGSVVTQPSEYFLSDHQKTRYTIFTQLIEGKLIPTLYDRFMMYVHRPLITSCARLTYGIDRGRS